MMPLCSVSGSNDSDALVPSVVALGVRTVAVTEIPPRWNRSWVGKIVDGG